MNFESNFFPSHHKYSNKITQKRRACSRCACGRIKVPDLSTNCYTNLLYNVSKPAGPSMRPLFADSRVRIPRSQSLMTFSQRASSPPPTHCTYGWEESTKTNFMQIPKNGLKKFHMIYEENDHTNV